MEQAAPQRLGAALRGRLDGELLTDDVARSLWATDASIYLRRPEAVVVARSERDVRRTLGAARAVGAAVTPRGTGTALAGQATAPGLALDLSRLDAVVAYDPAAQTCSVQPGAIQAELNAHVEPDGLVFGADTSTSDVATLGGMIGNNSAGMRSLVYGTTADQVVGLRCVLSGGDVVELRPLARAEAQRRARGEDAEARLLRCALELGERHGDEIRRRYPHMVRRVSGYGLDALVDPDVLDLTRLVCGSEGTLAVVTRADLRLHPLPELRRVATLEFDALTDAAAATPSLLETGPSYVELLDGVALDRARDNPAYRDATAFVQGDPEAVLLVEYSGAPDEVDGRMDDVERVGGEVGAVRTAELPAGDVARTVKLRKAILPLLLGTTDADKPVAFVEDAAVPPDRLEEFVARFGAIVAGEDTWACFYGHASVGCLHVRPALNTKDPAGVARMRRIAERVADLVVELGGSISGEHGDGLSRSEFLGRMYGAELVEAFAVLKRAWDPAGVLNPGVIVHPAPMQEHLRLGPEPRPGPPPTHLDFGRQGGFAAAVELCNGSGLCRKRNGGTMCPSYMATGAERDTTRARANALRSILDGTLAPSALTGERLWEVFDLCVACKACATECPSRVDVARMKTEVLAQRGAAHGFSVRQRAAAHARAGLAVASRAPGIVNAIGSTRAARRLAEAAVGIDRRRTLPRVAAPLHRRFGRLPQGPGPAEVALFADTWTTYQRPDIGEAAVRVLAAAGARVLLPPVACCGRPMLSEGLVEPARRSARANLDVLAPLAERGVPIAGLEPSCVSAITDDYASLLPDDPRVDVVAGATRL
ncbi:MAG TPA: FAD-binding and (Fe-S)-binding domain-containing protein, partial [Solirubrobacteraceae bacterium]|nr:FAD-binding and (Fe-S)-binding domain-containing protein [Solirubrobacteraceae bacterium]